MLTALFLIMTGCSSKPKTYSYNFDEYQGFSARNDFITNSGNSDPEARLLAEAEQNVLSVNLFDNSPVPKRAASNEKILSANLFELSASVHQPSRKTGVFERMLRTASTQLGTPYRSGGCDPNTGFDCSGFTTWVFNKYGIHLPRSSREQFQTGTTVAKNNLRKGDLVFFRSKRGINHVGIYLENGKFIHSASHGKTVTISHLDEDYWRTHYAGGRRVF
jgi:cell wall-associated NlpC family hydrolase